MSSSTDQNPSGILLFFFKNGPSAKTVRKLVGARSEFKRMELFQSYMKRTLDQYESSIRKPRKNNKYAEELRRKGNIYSIQKKLNVAWNCFNVSLRYAEKGSANLGLAFANRSNLFFDNGFKEACIQDIDLALSNNYPDHMKDKLLKRRELLLLSESSINDFFLYYEQIPEPAENDMNPFIQSARDNIKMVNVPMGGRRLVASKPIDVGEIVFVEKPYVAILDKEASNFHCSHCLEFSFNLIPCPNCCQEMYCGEVCLQEAAEQYHKYECRFIDLMAVMKIERNWRLALRAMLRGRNEYTELIDNTYLRSDKFCELHYLYGDNPAPNHNRFLKCTMFASLFYNLLKRYTTFFDDFPDEYHLEDNFRLMIMTVHRNIWTCATTINKNMGKKLVGLGVYIFRSLFGFSCDPNVFLEHRGNQLVGRAYRSIPPGEECCLVFATKETDSLIYTHVPKPVRQKVLNLFNLQCQCNACSRNWPLIKYMPTTPVEGITYTRLHEIYRDFVTNCSRSEIHKAILMYESCIRIAEKHQPNLIMVTAQKFLHNCYMLLGNRNPSLKHLNT